MQNLSTCVPLENLLNVLQKYLIKAMFAFLVFEILLFQYWSVLSPAQWNTDIESQKNIRILLKLLGK